MFQVNNQQIFAKSHQPEKETKKDAKPTIKSLKCDKILFFYFYYIITRYTLLHKQKLVYICCVITTFSWQRWFSLFLAGPAEYCLRWVPSLIMVFPAGPVIIVASFVNFKIRLNSNCPKIIPATGSIEKRLGSYLSRDDWTFWKMQYF